MFCLISFRASLVAAHSAFIFIFNKNSPIALTSDFVQHLRPHLANTGYRLNSKTVHASSTSLEAQENL